MNSFTLTAVGTLARDPEPISHPDGNYTRLLLAGSDYAGKDANGAVRTLATQLWFVAFGLLGEVLARNARQGDQLFIAAQLRVAAAGATEAPGGYQFVVDGFRFGAPARASGAVPGARAPQRAALSAGSGAAQARHG